MSNSALSRTSKLFQLTSLSITLTLVGCGGGNDIGSRDTVDSIAPRPNLGVISGTSGMNAIQAKPSGIHLLTNYSGIKLEKNASVEITALVFDDNNGVISGLPVDFKITNPELTGVFSNNNSQIETNGEGKAVIKLEILNPLTEKQKDYLQTQGVTIQANAGKISKAITLKGSEDNVDIQKQDVYDIFISSTKNELLTGKSSTTLDIKVTDKNGGIVAGVPVTLGIKDAAKYGLSFSGSSKQETDEKGLIQIELQQSNINIDSQLDHNTILTVIVDDGKNTVVEQNMPISVTGTNVSNVKSNKSTITQGETFNISGNLLDAINGAIVNADVTLLNNGKAVGNGKTNAKGEFNFKLNSNNLHATDKGYIFSLEAKGATVSQVLNDIIQVPSISSSSMSFSQVDNLLVDEPKRIVLNVPSASDGDRVYVTTNKGVIYQGNSSDNASNRQEFRVQNKKVSFYIYSPSPGLAELSATNNGETKTQALSFSSMSPEKLSLQVEKSVLSIGDTTSVTARVLDKDDAPVRNAVVQFTTWSDASGGSLNKGVAYTDDSGMATVIYTAGKNPTPIDGVEIIATVKSVKLPNGQEKTVTTKTDEAKITVQTKSSYISFAFADKVSSGDRAIYYYRNGSITVLNNTGKPAANQPVSISLVPFSYIKGQFFIRREPLPSNTDGNDSNTSWISKWEQESVVGIDETGLKTVPAIVCPSEDKNKNSILDKDEDINSNGQLDPINVAAILTENGQEVDSSKDFNFVTDSTGKINFQIRYPKEYAQWYQAQVVVNTRVDGSESQQSRVIGFPVLSDDVNIDEGIRPNWISPFRISASCESSD